uniref:Uncharacterized protein n=1 Tax=Macaca fascicularis TaxID=9541 RepID=Q8HXB5_MACFA|nr:hypothetical protein [Macaca fascicularis]
MGSMLTLQCCWKVEKSGFESASVHLTTGLQCLPLIFQLGHWDGFSFGSYKHTYVETRLSTTGGEPVRAGLGGSGSLVTQAPWAPGTILWGQFWHHVASGAGPALQG